VQHLAQEFGVSPDTIRRDLDYLDKKGLIRRAHGGAVSTESLGGLTEPFDRRSRQKPSAKQKIGRLAASLIQDGETVLFGGGTTTLAAATALEGKRELTIITNHLLLPSKVSVECYQAIYIIGGRYRAESISTFGGLQLPGILGITADRAILGVSGIDASGLSVAALEDASIISEMTRAARRRVIVADSSKFDRPAFARAAALQHIHILVTDAMPTGSLREALDAAGVEILVAS
jgi:DeoR family glycerol-3-phosphate regulon repressor/DeoR family fructose operon transcriptional repressor